jgi:alpha-beta hydrolase superfamily lysophospholipase
VVLFHGLTNCPQQFEEFALLLHARGDNVYVPRLPHHGHKNRLTKAPGAITSAEIEAAAREAAQHARGLGERVVCSGISLGATMALWLAQTGGVENAVGIAPFLMPSIIPRGPGMLLMHVLQALPNVFLWWDPRVKERELPVYAYPGFWTHCLAQSVFAGAAIFRAAAQAAPLAAACTTVVNPHDPAVNNRVARALVERWQRRGTPYRYTVWNDVGRRHDIIDPTTYPEARTAVYPQLAALLDASPEGKGITAS